MPAVMGDDVRIPHDDLVARLRGSGLRLPPDPASIDRLLVRSLDGGDSRWALTEDSGALDLARSMDGRILTHRLDEWEADHDRLVIDADLVGDAWDHLHFSGLTVASGEVVGLFDAPGLDWDGPLWMPLPPGAFEALGVSAGDLVGIAFSDGVARLTRVPGVAETDLGERLAAVVQAQGPIVVDEAFDKLVADGDDFRTAVAPITEIVQAHGLHLEGDLLMASAKEARVRQLARDVARVAEVYELDEAQARAVVAGAQFARASQPPVDLVDMTEGGPAPERVVEFARTLTRRLPELLDESPASLTDVRREATDPWVALALANEALDPEEPAPNGLLALSEELGSTRTVPATRLERAAMAYLAGRSNEFLGEPRAGEKDYQRCLATDPEHPYALLALAGIAADRGTYETAARLLDRAGADEHHPLRAAVAAATREDPPAGRTPGRNEPCWCGSGRKFKVCHARVSSSPLPARARALLARAVAWCATTDVGWISDLMNRAMRASGGRAQFDHLAQLVPDLILFEGGGLADYLQRREALIPADEALLAEQWLLEPRSLFEVEGVEAGSRIDLRDVLTGDRVSVQESTASSQLAHGHLVLTRVATVGDHREIFGGAMIISLAEREALIELLDSEPSAEEVIEFLAARHRLPTVTTTDGDPFEAVEGSFRTTDPDGLRVVLDDLFERAGDDQWHRVAPREDQGVRILASLELSGDLLTVHAMSTARFDRVVELLDHAPVPLVEEDHRVTHAADMLDGSEDDEDDDEIALSGDGGSVLGPDEIARDPELLAAMTEYMATQERNWLDESIPALGGVTPRQAAVDPTRREDVIRLLDSFPATGSPLVMDGGRLKAALGL